MNVFFNCTAAPHQHVAHVVVQLLNVLDLEVVVLQGLVEVRSVGRCCSCTAQRCTVTEHAHSEPQYTHQLPAGPQQSCKQQVQAMHTALQGGPQQLQAGLPS